MKKGRNLFLNIILLIIVFICSGIDTHSSIGTQRHYFEFSTGTDNINNKFVQDIDASDEDQMDQSHIFELTDQPEYQKSGVRTLPLPDDTFASVWQPPKVF